MVINPYPTLIGYQFPTSFLAYTLHGSLSIIIIILTPCGALPRPLGHAVPL